MSIAPILRQIGVHVPPGIAKEAIEDVGDDGDRSRQDNRLGPVLKAEPAVKAVDDSCQIAPTNEGENGGENELAHDDSLGRFYT